MAIDRSYKLCARCHRKLDARPEKFPQVRIDAHLKEQGEALIADVCLGCHQSHSPLEDL